MKFTVKEIAAAELIDAMLRCRERERITPSVANWILRCCGLLKAARSWYRKAASQ